jgi:sulfur-oxidizing protein SoxZ
MARALINIPAKASKGQIVEIKTLLSHPMETGFRPDNQGKLIARDIVNRFECEIDGALIFAADLHPAISANPFFTFTMRAERSGEVTFRWRDDRGQITEEKRKLVVE